jgi:hypothetical protein
MDGTTLNVPDTDANRAAFHLPKTGRGQSSYPKVRLVTLMAARSHLLVDAAIGAFDGAERWTYGCSTMSSTGNRVG